jgi:hypothetical protein
MTGRMIFQQPARRGRKEIVAMRKFLLISLVSAAWLSAGALWAEDTPTKFKSTGEGEVHTEAGYSPSDPLGSKPVNKEWDAGHPSTQAPYDANCKDDRCIRAEQRQMGTSTWQEDRASGLHKSPEKTGAATPAKASGTAASDKPSAPSNPSGTSSGSPSGSSDWKPE